MSTSLKKRAVTAFVRLFERNLDGRLRSFEYKILLNVVGQNTKIKRLSHVKSNSTFKIIYKPK